MEAKTWQETVMDESDMAGILPEVFDGRLSPFQYDTEETEFLRIAEAQAEISFKAGYEQGLKEQGSPRADEEIRLAAKEYAETFRREWIKDEKLIEPFKAGKKAGIREVVEWINKSHLFVARCPPQEGKSYVYLGDYILRYGKNLEPQVGFYRLSDSIEWQAELKEWGREDE